MRASSAYRMKTAQNLLYRYWLETRADAPLAASSLRAFAYGKDAVHEVGKPHPHESALLHVCGEATYTDDIIELQGTLHAALGLSQKAHARVRSLDLSKVRSAAGVVAVYTADDIPGVNECGAIIHDDPVL
eukprot:gene48524-63664_t